MLALEARSEKEIGGMEISWCQCAS